MYVCCRKKVHIHLPGLSSDAGFFIFVLCFWSYSRAASVTWKLTQRLCLTNLKPKQNHGLANILFSILILLFPNKTSLPSQTRETWSFLGHEASKGSRGAASSAEHWASAAPYAGCGTEGYCAAALLFTQNIKRKIEATSTYKDFRNPKGLL